MTACNPRSATDRAFSLIELVLVLAIVTVLATLAMPRYFSAQQRYRADAAARSIAMELEHARDMAQATSRSVTVAFDVTNNRCVLTVADDGQTRPRQTELSDDARIKSASFTGSTAVTFDGYGQASADGSVVVTSGGYAKTVTLTAQTGQTEVK
ncbi:MAG: prepilin-type N-terminal cleavage/methylation domain-containing protein [Phycisphaera sp.]|nr:prepilin-type N-terminal cleavage/methylation domain-containing protein [Phycisphaera sp.]